METRSFSFFRERRHKEWFWIVVLFIFVIVLGFLRGWFFKLQPEMPLLGNISLFALININVILLLLLAYLVLRNIVKLVFERRRNILGHKLRTRLVIAFVGITLIPTLPLFWLATKFISYSLDYWFSHRVEQSLEESVTFAKDFVDEAGKDLARDLQAFKGEIGVREGGGPGSSPDKPPDYSVLVRYHMDGMYCFDSDGKVVWMIQSIDMAPSDIESYRGMLSRESEDSYRLLTVSPKDERDGLIAHALLPRAHATSRQTAAELVALRLIPSNIKEELDAITSGYEDYLQLKLLQDPLKRSHFITFSIVTLLTVFGAIWFGFFLAKNITVPIQSLVSATRRIADGDLDVQLEAERYDEIGMLIASFNKMVLDLQESRAQLASAYAALQQSHVELENRRRYMEIVLSNIAAGVVSVDAEGRIMTMNKSAEGTFGVPADEMKGRHYSDFLQPAHMEIVKSFTDAYGKNQQPHLERQVHVLMKDAPVLLLIKVSVLRDDKNDYMGVVVVVDDLTELEKAQRMAAWREVARRIAHEIKNPLTPIQLSAQRLRRKYSSLLEEEESILDECTRTIVNQVDHMKHLVNEFSKFARLPRVQLIPCNLESVVEESLALYRHSSSLITFILEKAGDLPLLRLDHDQFKQVLINLLDNAAHAIGRSQGTVAIGLFYDPVLKIARLECADTGHGVSGIDKIRMFEPYYSTKEKGTGLGLAIVASIIADHNGFVRVHDNLPKGTVIVIELPG